MRIRDYLSAPQGTLEFDIKPVTDEVIESEINQYMSDAEVQAIIIDDIKLLSNRINAIFELDPITQDNVLELISEETRNRFLLAFCNRKNRAVLFEHLISC